MLRFNIKSNDLIFLILILQTILYLVVFANIPIARMIICFTYLLFVPGLVILRLMALNNLDTSDKVLFSVGLSIAFLMFMGLIINELGKFIVTNPLSLYSLAFSINTVILLFAIISSIHKSPSLPSIKQKTSFHKRLFFILISIFLLLLGSYGIFLVNFSGNNLLIFILVITISILVSLVFLKYELIPLQHHPFLLLIIFFCSLLFLSTAGYVLFTKYIIWLGDQWTEYYISRITRHFWNATFYLPNHALTSTYSMISVTILPTIFETMTGMDCSLLFKLLYPIVASFTVLGAYKLYLVQTNSKTAFLAAFFLIIISAFKGMGPSKQEIAQLFYVLLFLLILRKDVPRFQKSNLLIIFGSALIISHYSLAYIFLFTMIIFVIILALLIGFAEKVKSYFFFSLLISSITFLWYIFLNGSAIFKNLIEALQKVVNDLGQFFNPYSRGTALRGLGLIETPTIVHKISAALFLSTEILLVFGFIKLLKDKQKSNFSIEYKIFAILNMGLIAMNLLLPRIADTFLMERFYQTALIILAPLAVVGGKALLEVVLRCSFKKFHIAILAFTIFIPLFIFQTGFVHELTGVANWSVSFSAYRTSPVELYRKFGCIDAYYFYGAQWLSNNILSTRTLVYADILARNTELTAYAPNIAGYVKTFTNTTLFKSGDFIYLNPSNTMSGIIVGEIYTYEIEDYFLRNLDKIYSNGGSEVYVYAP